MNEDPKANAETPETEPSEVVADELNPEEQEDVSGAGWIDIHSHA